MRKKLVFQITSRKDNRSNLLSDELRNLFSVMYEHMI